MLRDLTADPAIAQAAPAPVLPAPAAPAVEIDGAGGAALAEVENASAVVAVVGLGYVGLPTAIALRDAGFSIVGLDTSASRLRAIEAGEVELLDAERDSLGEHVAGGGFVLTDRAEALNAADLVLICVPTPVGERRRPDPAILRAACASVVRHARPEQTIVLTSTTYVGCTRELLVQPLAERGLRAGEDVFVAFAPERIDPGVETHSQMRTPRVLGGVSETCHRRATAVLQHTCERLHRVSSPEAAEMVKRTHPLRQRGRPATVAEEGLRKLAGRPRHVVSRAHEMLVQAGSSLAGARVLVVGASYKPGVADAREAPAREIVARLLDEGADVDYHDPLVPSMRVGERTLRSVEPDPRVDSSGLGPEDYDLAIVVTVHPERDYGWLHRCPAVLDCTYRTLAGRRRMVP